MPDQIPEQIKTKRSNIMLEMSRRKQEQYEKSFLGQTVEVLMEDTMTDGDEMYQIGHTREYVKVRQKYEENLTNQLINIKIESAEQILH